MTVYEHVDVCLADKIYCRFDRRTAAERKFENKLINGIKKKPT